MIQSFHDLISPIDTESFLQNNLEQRHLHVDKKAPLFWKDLLSFSDLGEFLQTKSANSSNVSLVKDGKKIDSDEYVHKLSNSLDYQELYKHFHNGASIILSGLDRHFSSLNKICSICEGYFKQPFQMNIYASPPESCGFNAHYDTHDVFLLQISGNKEWTIFNSQQPLPYRNDYFQHKMNPDHIDSVITLRSGNLLYIPRGTYHLGNTKNESSLHITLGFLAYTWADAITILMTNLIKTYDPLRKSIDPEIIQSSRFQEKLSKTINLIKEQLTKNTLLEETQRQLEKRFINYRAPLNNDNFHTQEKIPNILKASFRKKELLRFSLHKDKDNIHLITYGKKISFPKWVEIILVQIFKLTEFSYQSFEEFIDEDGATVLLTILHEEGIICTTRTR